MEQEDNLIKQINTLWAQAEAHWFQRARVNWINFGDKNTKYFHAVATKRRQNNHIFQLKDDTGRILDREDTLLDYVHSYFQQAYSSQNTPNYNMLTELIQPSISAQMNEDLCKEVSYAKIKTVVFQLGAYKALGTDGFPGCFYQQHWDIIASDVCNAVRHFFNNGYMLKEMNRTQIVLVPKVRNPEVITQYRPISLCNFSYKIISKLLANRMKGYLDHLISPFQSAFIPGRSIQDNILIAHEAFHGLKLKKTGVNDFLALKLDIKKAYDSVDWGCLEHVLRAHGFCEKWIHWILQCVITVSYTALVNGSPTPPFTPQRGLHQGDPLSAYLYLFIADILSRLLMAVVADKKLSRYRIRNRSPIISHLLFADDSLVFCKAKMEEVRHLQYILQLYGDTTRQRVNFAKSAVIFSTNSNRDLRASICSQLGLNHDSAVSKFLGLPTSWGKSKKASLKQVVDKVRTKLKQWKVALLSQAGREVLIKAVAMSIPTYTMSCFLFPSCTCKEINKLIRDFWWGNNKKRGKYVGLAGR
ncbi:hypothetical protein SLA2020_290970 [Shorea laevis]